MILNKIRSWNKLSILGISLMLLNNISCIDYEDNVNPNEVTEEMMGFLGIGNNPMVGCTVACAVDVAQALSK